MMLTPKATLKSLGFTFIVFCILIVLPQALLSQKTIDEYQRMITTECGTQERYMGPFKFDQACLEKVYRALDPLLKEKYGERHEEYLKNYSSLISAINEQGRFEETDPMLSNYLNIVEREYGVLSEQYHDATKRYMHYYEKSGQQERATKIKNELSAKKERIKNGDLRQSIPQLMGSLYQCKQQKGGYRDCELEVYKKIASTARQEYGKNDPRYWQHLGNLIQKLLRYERQEEAQPYLREFDGYYKKELATKRSAFPEGYSKCLCDIPQELLTLKKYQEAKPYVNRCLEYLEAATEIEAITDYFGYAANFQGIYMYQSEDKAYAEELAARNARMQPVLAQRMQEITVAQMREEQQRMQDSVQKALGFSTDPEQPFDSPALSEMYDGMINAKKDFDQAVEEGAIQEKMMEGLFSGGNLDSTGQDLYQQYQEARESGNDDLANDLLINQLSSRMDSLAPDGMGEENPVIAMMKAAQSGDQEALEKITKETAQSLNEQLQQQQDTLSKDDPEYVEKLQQMAMMYSATRQTDKAKKRYREALLIVEQNEGKDSPKYKELVQGLYQAYMIEPASAQKERELQAFIKNYDKYLSPDQKGKDTSYFNFLLQLQAGNFADARKHIKKMDADDSRKAFLERMVSGMEVTSKVNRATENLEFLTFPNLLDTAILHLGQPQYDQNAYAWMQENIGRVEPGLLNSISESRQAQLLQKLQIGAEANLSYIAKAVKTNPSLAGLAYDQALRLKGLSIAHQRMIREVAKQQQGTALWRKYQRLQKQNQRLNEYYAMGREAFHANKKEIAEALAKKIALEEEFYQEVSVQLPNEPVHTWQDVQKSLKPGEAAIEMLRFLERDQGYWTDQVRYAALIIQPGMKWPAFVLLPEGKQMEEAYFEAYQNSRNGFDPNNMAYQKYWSPIQQQLQRVNKVYFSAGGIYHLINLNTLSVPETGENRLMDLYEMVMVNSTRSLCEVQAVAKNSTAKAVFFGNPTFNLTNRGVAVPGKPLPPLPYTEVGVKNNSKLFEQNQYQVQLYLRQKADEAALKAVESPTLLHLATHAYFTPIQWDQLYLPAEKKQTKRTEYPSFAALVREQPPARESEEDQLDGKGEKELLALLDSVMVDVMWMDPMLNSGLYLTGADQYDQLKLQDGEDGIIHGSEISLLNLDGTELVVLSACNSGVGRITSAEGVSGLKKAFQVAGAEDLIMTLWKVNDDMAEAFMSSFYQNWIAKGMNKEQAFRQAQLDMREGGEYEEPRYWGAFVLIQN